jgi:hypothetical protein
MTTKKKALDADEHDARRCYWCRDEKKKSKGPSLGELRHLAKDVYGPHAQIREETHVPCMRTKGLEVRLSVFAMPALPPTALRDERLMVCHPDRAVARRMLKAALEAAA